MPELRMRAPGLPMALGSLLARAAPSEPRSRLESCVRDGFVSIEDRQTRRPEALIPPGSLVRAVGLEAEVPPIGRTPPDGLLVLSVAPPWERGALQSVSSANEAVSFEVQVRRDGMAELWLTGEFAVAGALATLARAGFPVLGDCGGEGVSVEGGLRIRSALDPELPGWWPDEPVFAGAGRTAAPPRFDVSRAAARALARGHPWVLADDESTNAARFAAGTLVAVHDPAGECLGLARVEREAKIAARLWARGIEHPRRAASIEARVAHALSRREALLEDRNTNAMRLVHGEADELPGLFVDRMGPILRVLTTGRSCEVFVDRATDALLHQLAGRLAEDWAVVRVVHLRERPEGSVECVRVARGSLDPDFRLRPGEWRENRVRVRERGIDFWVDPGLGHPGRASPGVGLFLDQRENRARLARQAERGGRWLNLFAHTGAFSLALLAGGAEEVVSVDLSAAYLRWLEDNLELNAAAGIDPSRHRAVRSDGRRFFASLQPEERFAGVILDPPTAAAAGRRFWSVSRDLEPLIGEALAHLEPSGTLFVSRNDRRGADLGAIVKRCAGRQGISLRDLEPAAPGSDFPGLRQFREGDSFRAVIGRRE